MTQLSATSPREKRKKDKRPKLRPGARGVIINCDDHTRFVIVEPRVLGDKRYLCINLTQSDHSLLSGHCIQAIKDMSERRPVICKRDPERDDIEPYESTGVIVMEEPQVGMKLRLTYHRWTEDGVEAEGTRIPSIMFGRIRQIVDEA